MNRSSLEVILGLALMLGSEPAIQGQSWLDAPPLALPAEFRDSVGHFERRHWRREHGLPVNEIMDLYQTKDGYLWIATSGGLTRFDGREFQTYTGRHFPSLRTPIVGSMAEDGEGRLWICTTTDLVVKQGDRFLGYRGRDGLPEELPRGVLADAQGRVWLNYESGLRLWERGRARVIASTNGVLRAIRADSAGDMWLQDREGGFSRWSHVEGRLIPSSVPALPFTTNPPLWWWDRADRLWCLGFDATGRTNELGSELETDLLELGHGGWRKLNRASYHNHGATSFFVADGEGGAWFPDGSERSLSRLRDGRATRWVFPEIQNGDAAIAGLLDREGNLWVGWLDGGLHCWRAKRVESITRQDGLPDDLVWALIEDPRGGVWIGTEGGAVRTEYKTLPDGLGRSLRYSPPIDTDVGLPAHTVRSMAFDRNGKLWIATGRGLAQFDEGRCREFHFSDPDRTGGPNKFRCLYTGPSGRMWAASQEALHEVRPPNPGDGRDVAGHAVVRVDLSDRFEKLDVRAMLEDPRGDLWLGTYGHGLCRLQWRQDGPCDIAVFTSGDGLVSDHVWAIHRDSTGALWLGTERGLSRFANGRFASFRAREGLFDDAVNHVLEDDLGCLWVSSDHGVYRMRRTELESVASGMSKVVYPVRYDETDGMPSTETNGQKSQPAGLKTRDGRLWFPTTKGVAIFDPRRLPDVSTPPGVAIREVRANGRTVFLDGPSELPAAESSRATRSDSASRFELPPGMARILEFGYAAITLRNGERARFRHRLEGFSDEWFDAGTERRAVFTDLRPGQYRFRVRVANGHGVWNEAGAEFGFVVQPFWYQAWWFRGAMILAGSSAIGMAACLRIRALRRAARLALRVELAIERERFTRDLHDGLGADLARLQRLAEGPEAVDGTREAMAKLIRELAESARGTTRQLRDALWVTHPVDPTLDGLAARLLSEAETLLGAAKVRSRFDFARALPLVELSPEQRRHVLLFAREALTNVVRHGRATEARLRLGESEGRLVLEVQDNGCGFDRAALHASSGSSSAKGLTNLEARADALGGRFVLVTRPGQGTTVRLEFPLHAGSD